MINWGNVPLNSVLPFPFDSFDGGTGASITLTGLAVTDIEVYKGTSMTQRASDSGFALMDTDGIDLDGITGIHGFSIDTSDNTDAGFYAAGSFYWVVVSSVTIDGQTVNFIAGTFRLVAAEGVAGIPNVNATHLSGTAQTGNDVGQDVNDILTDTNDIQTRLPAALVGGRMASNAEVVGDKTGYSVASGGIGSGAIAAAEKNSVADAILDRGLGVGTDSGGRTVRNALRPSANKTEVSAGTLTVYKEDDTTTAFTAAVTTAAGNPISSIDPA